MYGILKRENSSATEFPNSNDGNGEYALPAFGYPNPNHGWVKCASKTFPGQDYYFNIDSACSTWIRPVSRFVPTPLVRPQNHIQDEDFWDPTPIGVSDIEDEDEDDYNDNCEIKIEKLDEEEDTKPAKLSKKEERQKKIYNDVLFKLYHCYGNQWNVEETEDVKPFVGISVPCDFDDFEEDVSEDCEIFLPEATYSSESEDETTESLNKTFHNNSMLSESFGSLCESHSWGRKSPESYVSSRRDDGCDSSGTFKTPNMIIVNRWKSPKKVVTPKKNVSKENASFENQNNREKFDYQIQNNLESRNIDDSDDFDDLDTLKGDNSFADDTLNAEACRDLELSFDEEDDDDDKTYDGNWQDKNLFGLPKLKTIEFSDLLTDPFRNRKKIRKRKRRASKSVEEIHKSPPKTVIKTVCTLNGITTVNYDYLTPQLPDGVVMTNLSDSGSSACYDAWQSLRNNENIAKNSSLNATNEIPKPFYLTHDLLNISEPCLSDSSTSSERSVGSKKPKVKKQSESINISEDSESDSSDSSCSSSSSSSGGSTSSKNTTDEPIRKFSRIVKKDVNKDPDLDLSSNSDKTWIAGSEDEEDC